MVTKALPIEIVGKFMREAPVDVAGMAHEIGLEIVSKPLVDNISGKIECDIAGPCKITINSTHPRTRQRFTIAHEIAHFILHRDLIGDGVTDDGKYRSAGLSDRIERQANSYAADILMPWQLVVEKHKEGLSTPQEFAKAFDVSPAVAEIRLKELEQLFA
jgi:Zn-dependent peptidase ImmA (M78 family)